MARAAHSQFDGIIGRHRATLVEALAVQHIKDSGIIPVDEERLKCAVGTMVIADGINPQPHGAEVFGQGWVVTDAHLEHSILDDLAGAGFAKSEHLALPEFSSDH